MIRPLIHQDIPKLARLHMRVAESGEFTLEEIRTAYDAHFAGIYLDHPWYDDRFPSLVNEESDGRITGLLGVMTRAMSFKGNRITMAVSSRLIVDPECRSKLAGIQLMKTFLNGHQDLSVADLGNRTSQKLWHAMGGTTSNLDSLHWSRLLRPCGNIIEKMCQRKMLKPFGVLAAPFGRIVDRVVAGHSKMPLAIEKPIGTTDDLDPVSFVKYLPLFTQQDELLPIYDHGSAEWVFGRLGNMWDHGNVYKILVRNDVNDVIGWFIYNLEPSGFGEVAQIAATEQSIHEVLRHLFDHAWNSGAVGLTGRLRPRFMHAFSDLRCRFHCTDEVALVHASDPEIVHAFETGNAFLTALEGEGCLYLSMTADCSEPPTVTPADDGPLSMPTTSDGEVDIDRVEQLVAEAIR